MKEIDLLKLNALYNRIRDNLQQDLSVTELSYEHTDPRYHSWTKIRYPFFVIHYVLKGKGTFLTDGKTYTLGKDDLFVFFADTAVSFYPDEEEPWSYVWFSFQGLKAAAYLNRCGLTPQEPVLSIDNGAEAYRSLFVEAAAECREYPNCNDIIAQAALLKLFRLLAVKNYRETQWQKTDKERHIMLAVEYVNEHFNEYSLTAQRVADAVGLNINYFSRLFKAVTGAAFTGFLTAKRLNVAVNLIDNGNFVINSVARLVGYENPLYFSTVFKRMHGVTPKEYAFKARARLNESKGT